MGSLSNLVELFSTTGVGFAPLTLAAGSVAFATVGALRTFGPSKAPLAPPSDTPPTLTSEGRAARTAPDADLLGLAVPGGGE